MTEDKETIHEEKYGLLVWISFLFMTVGAGLQYMKTCDTRNINAICIPSLFTMLMAHTLMFIYAYSNELKSMIGTYSISMGFVMMYLYTIYKIKHGVGAT